MRVFTHTIARLLHRLSQSHVKESGVQVQISEREQESRIEDLQHPRITSIFFLLPPI